MEVRLVLLALCLSLAGCNTMAGLGQDMQKAGVNLQDRATESQTGVAPDRAYQNSYNTQPNVYAAPPTYVAPDSSGYPPPPPRPYP